MQVNGATTPSPATQAAGSNTASLASKTQTDFLKLISAQLQYQNPMEPTKDTEFIGQMAQFDTLQKMEDMAKNMASLLEISQIAQASSLIGKQLTATIDGEPVTGVASKVTLAGGQATIQIGEKQVKLSDVTEIANEGEVHTP